jgi:hypothetical protein
MSWLPSVGRCDVAGPFGRWLLLWSGVSRSWWEPEGRGKVYLQHPAQRPEDSPGLRGRFDQGDHLGLGHQVLQLAAEAGRLVRHEPDQPAKLLGQWSLSRAGRAWVGGGLGRLPRRGRLPGPGFPPPRGRPLARRSEFARLGAGGERGEPGEQMAEPVNNQDDERSRSSVGGDPPCHRFAQPADDEAKSFGEAGWGGRDLHGLIY